MTANGVSREPLEAAVLELLDARVDGATICPSEAGRTVDAESWRDLMGRTHAVARAMAAEGRVVLTQGGVVRDPAAIQGVYRIRRA